MNTSFPSTLVRAYLAALGQIAAHLPLGLVNSQQKPAGPPPRRRRSDHASAPPNR
jgi:hypothetical protein